MYPHACVCEPSRHWAVIFYAAMMPNKSRAMIDTAKGQIPKMRWKIVLVVSLSASTALLLVATVILLLSQPS